jgi:hypothetical protein
MASAKPPLVDGKCSRHGCEVPVDTACEQCLAVASRAVLAAKIIDWFELRFGYNPNPSEIPDGEILRWALLARLEDQA